MNTTRRTRAFSLIKPLSTIDAQISIFGFPLLIAKYGPAIQFHTSTRTAPAQARCALFASHTMDDECELPVLAGMPYTMLIPFSIAWRSTSTALPWRRRANLVASHLQPMGFMTSPNTILAAADVLRSMH